MIMIIESLIRRQYNRNFIVSVESVLMVSDCLDTEVFAGLQ